jgi:hypothetical protein
MSQLLKPAIVIALYALLLPAVGPMLDHHYVEWQHNHGHVYFGGSSDGPGFHVHIYDTAGDHGHVPVTDHSGGHILPEGVAYFSQLDGSGSGPISSPSGPANDSMTFPDPGDHPLLTAYGRGEIPPAGITIAPPRKPPIT